MSQSLPSDYNFAKGSKILNYSDDSDLVAEINKRTCVSIPVFGKGEPIELHDAPQMEKSIQIEKLNQNFGVGAVMGWFIDAVGMLGMQIWFRFVILIVVPPVCFAIGIAFVVFYYILALIVHML